MSSSPTETFVDVTMPQMGVSVAEGTVVEWKKQPGDWVERDEIIASISTDKIDTDVEAPASGRVQEILVEVGTTVDVGVVHGADRHRREAGRAARLGVGVGVGERGHLGGRGRARGAGRGRRPVRRHDREHAGTAQRGTPEVRRSGPRRYSPVVMRIAAEHGIDLEQVEGTGRGGRVRKPDVLAYLEGGNGACRKSRRCTSRARTSPSRSRHEGGRGGGRPAALAHAPVDRQGDGRLAPDRGDVHDDHRGRPDRDRGATARRPA